MESQKQKLEGAEKEKEKSAQKERSSGLKEELEVKEKLLREKTVQVEHLVGKLRGYDRDMKDLYDRNVKQEEAIVKYQEVSLL